MIFPRDQNLQKHFASHKEEAQGVELPPPRFVILHPIHLPALLVRAAHPLARDNALTLEHFDARMLACDVA